jgi:hypothetical protein
MRALLASPADLAAMAAAGFQLHFEALEPMN